MQIRNVKSERSSYIKKVLFINGSPNENGCTSTVERLNQYFLMENMTVVSSQYWNQVHGFTAGDVKKDIEGLQTMRTLAQNMVWLLKMIECSEQNGIKERYILFGGRTAVHDECGLQYARCFYRVCVAFLRPLFLCVEIGYGTECIVQYGNLHCIEV